MSKEKFIKDASTQRTGTSIVAVGIGGGGGNVIGYMINEDVSGIEFVVADTDAQELASSLAGTKVQLGANLAKGLGTQMKPSLGKDAALESYDELRMAFDGADIVFITAGLGGGTGTGAAPVVAKIAKEIGALAIAVVTKPFQFEGGRRRKVAEKGLNELKKECDATVVIENDRLLSIIDNRLSLRESFGIIHSTVSHAVTGISGLILSNNENDISLELADLRTVMCHRGTAFIGMGEHQGENAAYEALKSAMRSPLFDNMPIERAMGILMLFHIHPDFPMDELTETLEVIHQAADEEADIIFSTTTDENMPLNAVCVTLLATGFERGPVKSINNINYLPIQPKI